MERFSERCGRRHRRAESGLAQQMTLFRDDRKLQGLLQELDIPNLTPLEAINKLYELQKQAQEEG